MDKDSLNHIFKYMIGFSIIFPCIYRGIYGSSNFDMQTDMKNIIDLIGFYLDPHDLKTKFECIPFIKCPCKTTLQIICEGCKIGDVFYSMEDFPDRFGKLLLRAKVKQFHARDFAKHLQKVFNENKSLSKNWTDKQRLIFNTLLNHVLTKWTKRGSTEKNYKVEFDMNNFILN